MIYTMGFTQKNAETFFEKIKKADIDILVDVRLNNKSQLAGFTKGQDLVYLLKEICDCKYSHEVSFAPTKEILDGYKKGSMSWEKYEIEYTSLLKRRKVEETFSKKFMGVENVLFLCSEPTPEQCHRRLLAEYIGHELNIEIKHI